MNTKWADGRKDGLRSIDLANRERCEDENENEWHRSVRRKEGKERTTSYAFCRITADERAVWRSNITAGIGDSREAETRCARSELQGPADIERCGSLIRAAEWMLI
jgi:hypothetical protein